MFWKILIILGLLKNSPKVKTIKVFKERYGYKLFSQEYENNKNWTIRKLKLKYMVEKGWKEPKAELQAIEDFEEAERQIYLDEKKKLERRKLLEEQKNSLICAYCKRQNKTVQQNTFDYEPPMCDSCKQKRKE